MNKKILCALICFGLILLSGCVQKKTAEPEKAVARIGGDSLTMSDVNAIVPDSGSDSVRIGKALIRTMLAGRKPVKSDSSVNDTNTLKLAKHLSMISGKQWTPEAADALLSASKKLSAKLNELRSIKMVYAYVDSIFTVASNGNTIKLDAPFSKDATGPAKCKPGDRTCLAGMLSKIFDIETGEALLVIDFMEAGELEKNRPDPGELVKGLVVDRSAVRKDPFEKARMPQFEKDNSMAALKFRPQQSIRDSIERHIPEIQALYKRILKKHENMNGNIWIVFRIDSKGYVTSATIKSTEISEPEFLKPFTEYVKTIRFQPIPDNVGNMRFEFPFEFKAEI